MNKSLRLVLIVGMVAFIAGCGGLSRGCAKLTGYDRVCIGGVSYLQFTSGVTVEYTPEGKVKTCK